MLKRVLSITKPARYWLDRVTYKRQAENNMIASLKDKYKNRPLLVIGNGPSLNKTPLEDFSGVPSVGMNKIDMIFPKVSWRPNIIVCMNNLVVKQHWKTFIRGDIPTFISWKGRWFVAKEYRRSVNYFLSDYSPEFSTDILSRVGSAGTVTYTALQFAYYMGANPVILFGVDHSFSFEGDPADLKKRKGDDVNHFDPNYFKDGQWWGLPNLELSELGYRNAKKAFEEDNRQVYDATIDGKLKVFTRISIDEAKMLCGIN